MESSHSIVTDAKNEYLAREETQQEEQEEQEEQEDGERAERE